MKCKSCGAGIQSESKFCSFCGSEVVKEFLPAPESIKEADKFFEAGISLKDEGKHNEALEHFKKAISLAPDQARYHAELATIFILKGNLLKAFEVANKSLELDNTQPQGHFARGILHYKNGNLSDAKQDLTTTIQLDPVHKNAYYWLGHTYNDDADYRRAIQNYSRSIEIDSQNPSPQAYFARGSSYSRLKKCEEAIQDYSKAIELDPESSEAYCYRGEAYDILGNDSNAIKDYSEAIQISPDYLRAYVFRGKIFEKLNQNQSAIQDYEMVHKLEPSDIAIHNRLCVLKKSDKAKGRNKVVRIVASVFFVVGMIITFRFPEMINLSLMLILVWLAILVGAHSTRCPGCRAFFIIKTRGKAEGIDRIKGYKTITRTDKRKNSDGKVIGEIQRQEQVRVVTVKYQQYYTCNFCGYKWATTFSRDQEDFVD